MRIGIVGKGRFGSIIHSKLKEHDIIFITGKEMKVSFDIDWVIIASTIESHYDVCKLFIKHKINIFVEKPITNSVVKTQELINMSKKFNVKIYVDDVFFIS